MYHVFISSERRQTAAQRNRTGILLRVRTVTEDQRWSLRNCWGGVATAAVQGRHTSDFLFVSTERNKITQVLLRWAGISEHFRGGLSGAALRLGAEVQTSRRGSWWRGPRDYQVTVEAQLTIFGLSNVLKKRYK